MLCSPLKHSKPCCAKPLQSGSGDVSLETVKVFKILFWNLITFILLLAGVETFFYINQRLQFLPAPQFPRYPVTVKKEDAIQDLGESILIPFPKSRTYAPIEANRNRRRQDAEIEGKPFTFNDYPSHISKSFQVRKFFPNDNSTVYNVQYTFDPYGRREVQNQTNKKPSKFIATFGCSYTFGEGVSTGDEYPSQLASKMNSSWKVYNFGFPGMGPNDTLDGIQKFPLYAEGVEEPEGVFVWVFIPDHMNRFFCPLVCYAPDSRWIWKYKTEYILKENKLEPQGLFAESKRLDRLVYQYLLRTATGEYFGSRNPPQYTQEQYDIFVMALQQISESLPNKKYLKKYLVVYQTFDGLDMMRQSLQKYGFELIDYTQIYNVLVIPHPQILGDTHPTSESYWYLSEIIKNRIERDLKSE